MKDEDIEYGKWQQARIERDWDNLPSRLSPQIHQKVGTVIPFSRTVDRDPWSRIPLTVPDGLPRLRWIEVWSWIVVAIGLLALTQVWL